MDSFERRVLDRSRNYLLSALYATGCAGEVDPFARLAAVDNLDELCAVVEAFIPTLNNFHRDCLTSYMSDLANNTNRFNHSRNLDEWAEHIFALSLLRSLFTNDVVNIVDKQHYLSRCYIRNWAPAPANTTRHNGRKAVVRSVVCADGMVLTGVHSDRHWWVHAEPHYTHGTENFLGYLEGGFPTAMKRLGDDTGNTLNLSWIALFAKTTILRLPDEDGNFLFSNIVELAQLLDAFTKFSHAKLVQLDADVLSMVVVRPKAMRHTNCMESLVFPVAPNRALVLTTDRINHHEAVRMVDAYRHRELHHIVKGRKVAYGLTDAGIAAVQAELDKVLAAS